MAWLILTAASVFVSWLAYLAGLKHGEELGERQARRARWQQYDDTAWQAWLSKHRIDP
jgi:membrane protein DedA with SNARE-associated domain